MADLIDCPCPYKVLYQGGAIGLNENGSGASLAFHIGAGVPGGAPMDILAFMEFVGGTPETVTIGGVTSERLVPLKHPFLPDMMAVGARAEKSGRGMELAPGWTDWKVFVDFALMPYTFSGDTPYMTIRRRYGATAITLPGRAFTVAGVRMEHDVARIIPEILYNVTKYNVPTMDDSVFKVLSGKLNQAAFLGYAPKCVRFDGVEDEISTNIGMVTNRTVSLSLAMRPLSWNAVLLPSGVWAEPVNVNDGKGIYELGDFNLLLQ